MKSVVTKEARLMIQKFWKKGFFDITRMFFKDKYKKINKLVSLKIISTTNNRIYKINRDRYLELTKETNQISLF